MEYKMNLGSWNSVFAVPCDLVDKHIKLAGAAQLKVLLWFLRHAGENMTVEDIAKALSMQTADVRDCLYYWSETELVSLCDGTITPSEMKKSDDEKNVKKEEESVSPKTEEKKEKIKPSRPEKPDVAYIARRIEEDEGISYLIHSADEIFGRLISNNDKATLLMIHESYGLPIEVIIMLLQYVAGIGKCNIYYIEKTAINWMEDGIITLELAEKKIQSMTSGMNAAVRIQRVFGLDSHSPTEKEIEYAEKWINVWKFSDEMLRKAYEVCINAKGKYIIKYIDSVLARWYNNGIKTPDKVDQDQKKSKPKSEYEAVYDISEFERSSVVD